jgi:hypothetical protein
MDTNTEPSRHLVEEIARVGLLITGVLEDLLDGLPEDAFPGESEVEVLLEMMAGTIDPAVRAAGDATVHELLALLGALSDRILTDLREAVNVARARED